MAALPAARQANFTREMSGAAPKRLIPAIRVHKKHLSKTAPKIATRKASELALAAINPVMPETMGWLGRSVRFKPDKDRRLGHFFA